VKFRELLEDYCKVEGIQIVRVLNLDTYLAVIPAGEGNLVMLRYLNGDLPDKLKNNELTAADLLREMYHWHSLEEIEDDYSKSDIDILLEGAIENGYVMKKNERNKGVNR